MRYTHTGTDYVLRFAVEDAPVAPMPYSDTEFIATRASVTVTVEGTASPVVTQVRLEGQRAKNDGTAGRQPASARYTPGWNKGMLMPEPPQYVDELAKAALAMVVAPSQGGGA